VVVVEATTEGEAPLTTGAEEVDQVREGHTEGWSTEGVEAETEVAPMTVKSDPRS